MLKFEESAAVLMNFRRLRLQVTLTRCMYAQLMQQQFTPDRRSGWHMLPPTSPGAKARELGMKLAHGLEMVCHHCRSGRGAGAGGETREIVSMMQWERFVRRLQNVGYFEVRKRKAPC